MSPRAFGRAALRHAIRNHPDFLSHFPEGSRAVGSLTIAQLLALAGKLALDGGTILKTAKAAHADTLAEAGVDASETDPENEDEGESESETEGETAPDPIDSEVAAIRDAVMRDGFSALDERLRDLVREARKPAVVTVVTAAPISGDCPQSRPTARTVAWGDAFGVTGTLATRTAHVWDGAHPNTPAIDPLYVWPDKPTQLALTQLARGRNVYAFGPAGTGKTEFAEQIAARLGRPFALISCDSTTDGPTLVGMTVPKGDTVGWQDGQLTRAIQTPGCVVCIDEPSVARPGALFVMQNMLAKRVLWISEAEGRRVPVAPGVMFLSTDNTAGLGGGSRKGYTDTNRLNGAYLDRFGARIRFSYLPEMDEAKVIVARTGATPALAKLLVQAATLTRAAEASDQLTNGIGLRRLLAWAEMLTDGNSAEDAFEAAILNAAPDQDQETLRQQCSLACDASTVAMALAPPSARHAPTVDPTASNPTPQGRRAASDFQLTPGGNHTCSFDFKA